MILKFVRLLFFPFSLLYGLAVIIRNALYHLGWLPSTAFQLPVIVVGNLAVGGSGKSPMTEYLVRLFKSEYRLAVLSRGYGRKSKGFRLVKVDDMVALTGDEPLQFKQHFPDITIAVCENRVNGVERLKIDHELIVLDDAFQHRALSPSFQILLFDFASLKKLNWLLPTGNLREPMWAKNRADIIVVTKSPKGLSAAQKLQIRKQLKPKAHQALFFSYLKYGALKTINGSENRNLADLNSQSQVLLLTGIANAKPLLHELNGYTQHITHWEYPDHYAYTAKDMAKMKAEFEQIPGMDKLIITTEKDAQRLIAPEIASLLSGLPLYQLPVEAEFEEPDKEDFDHLLKQHVREHTNHH
ncbi:MAG: tetraacyldisaccharide 4'-kinase [Sphingobacteriaceae bacterium]